MNTTERRPEKRLVRCAHPSTELCDCRLAALAEVFARWPPTPPGQTAEQPERVRVVLAELRGPVVRPPYQRPEPPQIVDDGERRGDWLGAAGAWACVIIVVVLLAALAFSGLRVWLT
ncbi:MAG: hypothetical protein ACRDSF_14725 [Pseudonocardiaceae bacterium]